MAKKTIETKPATPVVAWIALAAAVLGILVLAAQLRGARKAADDLSSRLAAVEASLSKAVVRIEEVARARTAPAQRSGPDPAKIYTVRAEGAPSRGNPAAPVLIAEVSDFQ